MGQKVQCNKCKDIIESKHRHDFITCECGAIAIDGGNDYLKLSGNWEDIKFIEDENIILLVDVDEWEEETTFGTCELCEWEGTAHYQNLVFRQNGETFKIGMYEWNWGDFNDYSIPNKEIISFAEFIKTKKITDREFLEKNIDELYREFSGDGDED